MKRGAWATLQNVFVVECSQKSGYKQQTNDDLLW
jgi:hypothetical protein